MKQERFDAKAEAEFLNKISHQYNPSDEPQTQSMRKLILRTFEPYIRGGLGLELGCSDGLMTEMISNLVDELHVVDASTNFLERAKERGLAKVKYFKSLFEEYQTTKKYDYVFASYIMEHVYDPAQIFNMVKKCLKPNGLLFIVVPNARALSRQIALHMNLYQDLKELTENDHRHGHRRVYDRVNLNRDIDEAGFVTVHQGGIMLKILADFQMDKLIGSGFLGEQHIEALYSLGLEYPDLCGSLFSVCRVKN